MEMNLLDRDTLTSGAADEWSRWLRLNAPVHLHPEPDGPGFWVLSKHADITAASRNHTVFSSALARGRSIELTAAEREPLLKLGRSLVSMDPPEHTEHREALGQAFGPGALTTMELDVQEAAALVFDHCFNGRGPTVELDVVEELAGMFSIAVLARVLGVPRQDWRRFYHDANAAAGFDDAEDAPERYVVDEAINDLQQFGLALARERRLSPRNDVITRLAEAEIGGEPISDVGVMANMVVLFTAGYAPTRATLLHGLDRLVEFPEQYEAIRQNPALIGNAVEEILRWATPVQYIRRVAREDVEIRGQQIPAGSTVALWFFSANRDEDVFADPYQFDITRSPNRHLTFGGGGPHLCVGAPLARLGIAAFLKELTSRVRVLGRAGPTVPRRSSVVRGVKSLPLSFTLE